MTILFSFFLVLIKEIPCLCGLDDESWKIVSLFF